MMREPPMCNIHAQHPICIFTKNAQHFHPSIQSNATRITRECSKQSIPILTRWINLLIMWNAFKWIYRQYLRMCIYDVKNGSILVECEQWKYPGASCGKLIAGKGAYCEKNLSENPAGSFIIFYFEITAKNYMNAIKL